MAALHGTVDVVTAHDERVLAGGNVAPVVRTGNTIRRATGPWTSDVHRLLRHLERSDFAEAPRVHGVDESGREILDFLPGDTVGDRAPWPAWAWTDESLVQAARLLRRYHAAVVDLPVDGNWRFPGHRTGPRDVVCHNDLAPYNVVWRDGRIAGVIDWDTAAPGPPEWDLAFLIWSWAPLSAPAEVAAIGGPTAPGEIVRRLRMIVDAYGPATTDGMLALVAARASASVDGVTALAASGDVAMQRLVDGGHLARMTRDRDHITANAEQWQRALDVR